MVLNRKIWLGLTLVATSGIAAGLAGCGGKQGGESGEGGEGGEAAAPTEQAQGGESGEGGEAGAATQGGEGGEGGEHGPPGGEAGEGGESASTGDYPGGEFSVALKKVLAAEGGEHGIGFVKSGRSMTAPALSDAQISEAFGGNTLHSHKHFAYHFDKGGALQGWEVQWAQVENAKCAGLESTPAKNTGLGDGSIHLFDGECWRKTIPKTAAGKWTVRDGMLCTEPALQAVTGTSSCGTVFMIFNRLAVYDGDKMVGKGGELSPGNETKET